MFQYYHQACYSTHDRLAAMKTYAPTIWMRSLHRYTTAFEYLGFGIVAANGHGPIMWPSKSFSRRRAAFYCNDINFNSGLFVGLIRVELFELRPLAQFVNHRAVFHCGESGSYFD